MRRHFLTLDTVDVLCLTNLISMANKVPKMRNSLITELRRFDRNVNKVSINYQSYPKTRKSKKKIFAILKFYSNHFTCNALNTLTFENFINFKCLKFLYWLSKCNSDCFLQV